MQKHWMVCGCLGLAIACSNQGRSDSDQVRGTPSSRADALLGSGISAEVLLDAPVSLPLYSEAPGPLSISADPAGFFVTWLDRREFRGPNPVPGGQVHVVATRVSSSGVVANPSGSILSKGAVWDLKAGAIGNARSAFNGQYYLVAWHKLRPSPTNPIEFNLSDPSEIDAVRVSATGELIDAVPFVVSALPAGDLSSVDAVLSNGAGFLVAWSGETSSSAAGPVQSRTLAFAGSEPVLDPIKTYPFTGGPSKYAFIFNGLGYVAASVDAGNTGFTVGALSHAASTDCQAIASPSIDAVATGSNGAGETLVAYRGRVVPQNGPCTVGTKAVLIGPDGSQKAPPISLGASNAPPAVSYVNGKYYVAGFQIDPVTNTASPTTSVVPSTVACNSSTCLGAVGNAVSRVSATGVPLDDPPIAIGSPAPAENEPIVTAGAGKYLAVWYEQTSDDQRVIRAGRLDAAGASLDPIPTLVGPENSFINGVQFNGTDFVVSWTEPVGYGYAFRITRISPSGVSKDPTGIELTGVGGDAVMACAATECLVAWSDSAAGGIAATRIAADGSLLDSPPLLQVLPYASPLMLAYADGAYVMEYVTSDQPIDSDHPAKVFLQKLDLSAHPLGAPLPVAGTPQALRPCGSGYFSRTFVLVGSAFTWFASLLDSNAQVVQAKVDLGSGIAWEPISSVSLASGCVIAWARYAEDWDIYAKRLSNDDNELPSSPLRVASDAFNEFSPALAAGADGKVLAVYRHFIAQSPYGSFRIAARLIDPSAFALGAPGSGGSGGEIAGGMAGALTTGGSINAGATGGDAESGEGGEMRPGHSGGSATTGGSLATGGAAAQGGAGGSVVASAGSTEDVAGAVDQGVAGVHGGHESGGSGCAVSPRRAPVRDPLPVAFMLIGLASTRRSRRRARHIA